MASLFHYKKLRRLTLPFLLFSTALSILVFIPGVGVEHGGARRWISIFGLSFQPAELLKLAFVIYAAAILSAMKEKSRIFSRGPLLLLLLSSVAGALLLLMPLNRAGPKSFITILLPKYKKKVLRPPLASSRP